MSASAGGASGGAVVARFDDLVDGGARRFEVAGRSVAVVRIGDAVYAIGDTCSHADVSLSEGEVDCDAKEIECWKHGSAFSLETGVPQTLPATQPVPVFVARVVDGDVVIEIEPAGAGPSGPAGTAQPASGQEASS